MESGEKLDLSINEKKENEKEFEENLRREEELKKEMEIEIVPFKNLLLKIFKDESKYYLLMILIL